MSIISGIHPLRQAMQVIGGRWRAILVYSLLDGPKRFNDLQKEIPGISERMLALDLRKLEEAGIVLRTIIPEVPVRVEYQLTPEGLELRLIVSSLYFWGQKVIEGQKLEAKRAKVPLSE